MYNIQVSTVTMPVFAYLTRPPGITKGASTLTGRGHATLVLTPQIQMRPLDILFLAIGINYVNVCNYPIMRNIAEQARELDRARRVDTIHV